MNFKMSSAKWQPFHIGLIVLTHLRLVPHTCVCRLGSIGSDNGLSPVRRQANTWTNADLLSIGPLGTNVSEMLIEILIF